jgi:phage-related protein
MREYTLLFEGEFRAYALVNEDGSCSVEDLLEALNAVNQYDATTRRTMTKRLEYPVEGKLPKGSPVHHYVENGIWQISSGKYRLMYFFDKERIIICTHWFEKKSSKTPQRQIRKALLHREKYFEAQQDKTLFLNG